MSIQLGVKLPPKESGKDGDVKKEAKENFISNVFDFGKGLISGSTPNRYQDMYNKPPGATTQATAAPVMGRRGGARTQVQSAPVRINSKEERDRLAPGNADVIYPAPDELFSHTIPALYVRVYTSFPQKIHTVEGRVEKPKYRR